MSVVILDITWMGMRAWYKCEMQQIATNLQAFGFRIADELDQ